MGISYLVFRCIHYVSDAEVPRRPHLLMLRQLRHFLSHAAGRARSNATNVSRPFTTAAIRSRPGHPLPILHRIATGLMKKYVLADNLLAWGSLGGPPPAGLARPLLWLSVLSLLLFLYLDFSGYCDIVIGVAALMGFRLMENFNRPFLATNLQDFWNRWHISLTSIVRDYVFTPLNH